MPEAVRKRAAQADALIEAQRQARMTAVGAPDAEAVPDPEQDPEAPAVTDPTLDQGSHGEPTDETPEPPQTPPDSAVWEQRWRSLDGQLRARDRQIEQLQGIIASMQSAPAPAPAAPVAPTSVNEEDEENFGSDLVDMVRRASRSEATQLLNNVMQRLDKLEQKLTGVESTATVTAHATFEDRLARLVPNWETLNYDQGFIDWLQASSARNRVFQTAASDKDVPTVADFFLEYEKLTAKPAKTPAQNTRKEQLAKQVAPGKGRTAPAAPEPDHLIWTRSSIAQFYRNKSQYSPSEFARLEKDLFNAQQQGRVDLTK